MLVRAHAPIAVVLEYGRTLYYAHFLFLVAGGGLYLFLGYWRRKKFYSEPFVDFLFGVGCFIAIFIILAALAPLFIGAPAAFLRSCFNFSVPYLPGVFLAFYGAGLLSIC
ncbi:MAG: hypothetical protein ACYCPQ_03395 [Elusimicrobiota bacterium]